MKNAEEEFKFANILESIPRSIPGRYSLMIVSLCSHKILVKEEPFEGEVRSSWEEFESANIQLLAG